VVHLAAAPKSNAVYLAIGAAIEDVRRGLTGPVPVHLRDASYPGAAAHGHGQGYQYPHDHAHGIVAQQYAPDVVQGREYYQPTERGAEREVSERLHRLRQILKGGPQASG
jgi:putative ATPase